MAASSPKPVEDGSALKPSRWRKPSSPWKLLACMLVALILALSLLAVYGPEVLTLPLKDDSQLDYSMSGSLNNTTVNVPFTGYSNITIHEFSKDDYSWGGHSSWWGGSSEMEIESPPPFFWKASPPGTLIGYDRIQTPLGEKNVGVWFSIDFGRFIFYDVGIESSVVYRMTVSSQEYHFCWILEHTNNTNLYGFDNHPRSMGLQGLSHPSEEPSIVWNGGDNGSEMYGGYCGVFGLLETKEGERLRYEITGNLSSALIFDRGNIDKMHDTGAFQYNETLSKLSGDPGEVDVAVDPGLYWFLFEFGSNGHVAFYWTSFS